VFNKSLTIVLPIRNEESRLRNHVRELLEIASELTPNFKILIVDDGSTDATYEVAENLVAHYPQVSVRRHRYCRGLGPVMDYVRRHVRSDAIIFHDGVSPIDVNQMRIIWRRWVARFEIANDNCAAAELHAHDVCDFANLPAIHAAMERAHGQLLGFHLLVPHPEQSGRGDDELLATSYSARADGGPLSKQTGVGRIPCAPRPKFLSAVAEFALGE
jgi:glycosyltransferase involved in cell wall biosynthesis